MATRKFTFISSEGYQEEFATTDDATLGRLDLLGISGVSLTGNGGRATGFGDPTGAQDLATKFYVDAVATGLDWKASCRLGTAAALPAYTPAGSGVGKTLTGNANGALSVDGVAVAVNDRILVMSENSGGAHVDHGIYTVTQTGDGSNPFILTRATDADQNAEVTAGLATFVTEGTANADKGFVLITNDPITVDTTTLDFAQFSSTVAYTFDQGLSETAGSVKVELDTAADAQGAGAGGGSSGLEFDVNTAAGKLRAAVSATRAINRFADGLGIEVDPQANTAGNNPSASVSATGLKVESAPRTDENLIIDEAIAAGDPVAWSTVTNNRIVKARADDIAKSRVIGVARTAGSTAGDTVAVVRNGIVTGTAPAGSPAVGVPVYLGATGGKTTVAPGAGNRFVLIGYGTNATDVDVRITDYGKKAA